jgi:glycosyltransferase involved in cell wall biosynthesis
MLLFLLQTACAQIAQKSMVIIIPSYNNIAWYEGNLNSACFQEYDNYRIIYIDDASTDGTGDAVQAYIEQHQLADRVTFIRNTTNKGALANIYYAVLSCNNTDIIVLLDGDDRLMHNRVLQIVNEAYADEVWLTYGQFQGDPDGVMGCCAPMPAHVIASNSFRRHAWVTSHLRTFYAKLFKNIKAEDMIADNEFMRVAWDLAFMIPMLEMAGERIRFIPDVLYLYNKRNPISDFRINLVKQEQYERMIRSKPMYTRIDHLF